MPVISMSLSSDLPSTPIPNAFIDNYIAAVNPTFTIVYIFFYRHNMSGNRYISLTDAAETIGILESDVIKALKHWEKEGLLKFAKNDDGYSVTFLDVPVKKCVQPTVKPAAIELVKPAPAVLETRPKYTVQELEIYKRERKEIDRLFTLAENCLGKLLTYNDLSVLFGLYDWLRLPLPVIEVLVKYCTDNGHRSMRYIERVAVDWSENEITTPEAAESYIGRFGTDYTEVLKAFGHSRRTPTKSETNYMKKWFDTYEMTLPVILEACDKTIMQIGQPKFSYADKILSDWNEKGIRSVDDIKAYDDEFRKSKDNASKLQKSKKSTGTAKTSKFVNFKQRDWDYDKIEALERQYLNGANAGEGNES